MCRMAVEKELYSVQLLWKLLTFLWLCISNVKLRSDRNHQVVFYSLCPLRSQCNQCSHVRKTIYSRSCMRRTVPDNLRAKWRAKIKITANIAMHIITQTNCWCVTFSGVFFVCSATSTHDAVCSGTRNTVYWENWKRHFFFVHNLCQFDSEFFCVVAVRSGYLRWQFEISVAKMRSNRRREPAGAGQKKKFAKVSQRTR